MCEESPQGRSRRRRERGRGRRGGLAGSEQRCETAGHDATVYPSNAAPRCQRVNGAENSRQSQGRGTAVAGQWAGSRSPAAAIGEAAWRRSPEWRQWLGRCDRRPLPPAIGRCRGLTTSEPEEKKAGPSRCPVCERHVRPVPAPCQLLRCRRCRRQSLLS